MRHIVDLEGAKAQIIGAQSQDCFSIVPYLALTARRMGTNSLGIQCRSGKQRSLEVQVINLEG